MRSLTEAKSRWEETFKYGGNIESLQNAIKSNNISSSSTAGLRSIYWKAFLLYRNAPTDQWLELTRQARSSYAALCEEHLRFIRHPEQLAAVSFDPLADDPDNPWNSVRRDEAVRAEILQDVRRLPDEPFYHEEGVQRMILDILFLYCKLNSRIGGYRQGMHELLAPIVWVVAQDAVDRTPLTVDAGNDTLIAEMLDSAYIEHDAYALFSKLMEKASTFYETEGEGINGEKTKNTIVERSKYIHEVALMKVDEELATHFQNIEVLPQVFLIRWIRLLFGREFEFDQLLTLWDTLFAFDPTLDLVDLICVAMLLRIRWTLLETDYAGVLRLSRQYPSPPPPYGPHTFIEDAMYLKDHLDATGGATLILKYSGKNPVVKTAEQPKRPLPNTRTPSFQKLSSLRQRTLGARSPLSVSAKILQQPGAVEALLQGAAKNVMERSEKLGINRAVRDAMGEIRRNVQGFQEVRSLSKGNRSSPVDNGEPLVERAVTMSLMERKNRKLAAMLGEVVASLKSLEASGLHGEKSEQLQVINSAAAKIQFIQTFLEDSTLALPEDDLPSLGTLSLSSSKGINTPAIELDTAPSVTPSSAVEETRTVLSTTLPNRSVQSLPLLTISHCHPALEDPGKMDTDPQESDTLHPLQSELTNPSSLGSLGSQPVPTSNTPSVVSDTFPNHAGKSVSEGLELQQPKPTIPTRSTLAQSSFAWMLEPDTTSSSLFPSRNRTTSSSSSTSTSPFPNSFPFTSLSRPSSSAGAKPESTTTTPKRVNSNREKNAFLFGEVVPSPVNVDGDPLGAGTVDERVLVEDGIFGLKSLSGTGGAKKGPL